VNEVGKTQVKHERQYSNHEFSHQTGICYLQFTLTTSQLFSFQNTLSNKALQKSSVT
jgi:hypothetical protein